MLGILPSLAQQQKAALDTLESISSAANQALFTEEVMNDEAKGKEAFAESEKIKAAEKEAREAIEEYYAAKIKEAGNVLSGKTISTEYDKAQYSDVKITINGISDDNNINCKYELTLAQPLPVKSVHYIKWQYLDAEGKEISKGATPVKDFKNEAGSVITFENSFYPIDLGNLSKISVSNN